MAYPTFASGDVLLASDMNAVGLWLVKTQTVGSAVASVTVSDAFSSTYDNYLITLNGGTQSANTSLNLRLGASTTGYYQFLNYGLSNTTTPLGVGQDNANNLSWVGGGNAGQASHVRVEVFGPNLAAYTKFSGGAYQNGSNYGTMVGEHRVATAYTSFEIIPATGTLTGGTIRVYGYRN